jgi:Cu2+-exporting ATPase
MNAHATVAVDAPRVSAPAAAVDPSAYVRADGQARRLSFIVDNLQCAACAPRIEDALATIPDLTQARVNATLGRLEIAWQRPEFDPGVVPATLAALGYQAIPYDPTLLQALNDRRDAALLRAVAVSGFAAANIMLLSISVWSGHASDMGAGTRDFFHWISALIALPTVAYAGQPFFASAWSALRARQVNMDVPISLGVLLATCMSVFETLSSQPHAYFDAAVMLLFFLLIGRYLDQRMRARATAVAANLLALQAIAATVIRTDGSRVAVPARQLTVGTRVAVTAGGRIPADGTVASGASDLDTSLITGESLPAAAGPGTAVYAGTLALTGSLEVVVTRAGTDTLLSQVVALMESASQGRSRVVRLADRAARRYAPAVHVLAATTFAVWMVFGSGGWHPALMAAISVLIITCPCAIGLAVPAVQAVATGRLLRRGVLVKAPDALERLAAVDTVVLDKTGTLTLGRPELLTGTAPPAALALARRLALSSRHPLCEALVRALPPAGEAPLAVTEHPGLGLSASWQGRVIKLGSRAWCGVPADVPGRPGESELWLREGDAPPVRFGFRDRLRPDAVATIAALRRAGLAVAILSGDRTDAVAGAAAETGIADFTALARPADKIARLQVLAGEGRKVLMVGDGLNDAPALAAAHASMSPASAADISQTAADVLFRGERLGAVAEAIVAARAARRRIVENFALAIAYNVVAVPLAMAGLLTPLIAAVAMSGSSIVVVLNALRPARGAQP